MNEISKQVRAVMSTVFDIKIDEIPDNAAPGILEKWDSLKHMSLILALEEEFSIRFTDDEMTDLLDFPLIVQIISAKKK